MRSKKRKRLPPSAGTNLPNSCMRHSKVENQSSIAPESPETQPGGGPLRELLLSVVPDAGQLELVQDCLGHVQVLTRQLLGEDAAVVVQGSYAQGLALRGSDLDVAVILGGGVAKGSRAPKASRRRSTAAQEVPAPDAVDRQKAVACLRRLATALAEANLPEIRIALRIFTAKVPVLRLHCGGGGAGEVARTVVDVSVGSSLLRGACDRGVYDVLQCDTLGIAAALCRLVKLWAKRRRLTDTLRGGLSSFSLVLLAIYFLQQRSRGGAAGVPSSKRDGAICAALPPQHQVTGEQPKAADPESGCPAPLGLPLKASEEELARLLLAFFTWACEDLPKLEGSALSIASAQADPRLRSGGVSRKPVFIEVPFAPRENAARCLRPDVWETLVCRELARGQRLARRLIRKKGRARASLVRLLFAASGSVADAEKDVLKEEEEVAERNCQMQAGELPPAADDTLDLAGNWDLNMEGGTSSSGGGRAGRKRRQRLAREAAAASEAEASPRKRRRNTEAAQSTAATFVAPVDRWLGLRSLLGASGNA
eukprot:TRINITY_DN53538_c0_g1_i1.p1 TRINITY_DN53538_c0_g1~~TRINITY_DN53538_c0_g1_i1.p1  ORF type:complete len:539 (-),score=123.92 TRINITY_DN53538_c0_g1_i1:38-1654(-)